MRRRRWRFTIGLLMVVIALIAIPLSYYAELASENDTDGYSDLFIIQERAPASVGPMRPSFLPSG